MNKDGAVEQQSSRAKVTTVLLRYCAIALLFVFIGCGGPSAPTLSAVHEKAVEHNQKAAKAVEKGDYEKALAYYTEALKINRSIENTEGIAVNLINIAVLFQKKGDVSRDHEFIDIALSIPGINNEIRSDAAYEKARIYLKEKNFAKAKEWVNISLSLNKGIFEGSRWNLMGRISFTEGKYDEALTMANTALNLNIENKQRSEEANSFRLMAEVNAKKGTYSESKTYYIKALEIDKELGNSKKIAMTLRAMGMLSLKQGNLTDAVMFYMRAYDVSSNAGDKEGVLEALDSLSDAYRKSGNEKKAEEMMEKKADMEKKH
ncbi:MAG: tetratricopeptide repeat protein [Thermodesulfovibrionales bacterium]|nr:tetratricopeptide repeat protein [Thermodesulfovibrionales bacterium]